MAFGGLDGSGWEICVGTERDALPCTAGCGFRRTWHPTYCCFGCGDGHGHGPKCDQRSLVHIEEVTLHTRDGTRTAIVHLPPSVLCVDIATLPAVVAFHGKGGQGSEWLSKLTRVVDSGLCVGIYPNGLQRRWNMLGSGCDAAGEHSEVDENEFVDKLLLELQLRYGLLPSRFVALGFSNGAGMVNRLLAVRSHFKRAVVIATALCKGQRPDPSCIAPSIMQVMGMADRLIPYDGGRGEVPLDFEAAEESARIWAAHANCESEGCEVIQSRHGSVRMDWHNPATQAHVVHIGLARIGHGLPDDLHDSEIGLPHGVWPAISDFLLKAG